MIRFYQITDLHYYAAQALQAQGPAWEMRAVYDQKCLAESEAIVDAAFQKIADDPDTPIVLISGDVVCDGEMEGHRILAGKLRELRRRGKKICLITASHDIRPDPKGYSPDRGEYIVPGATKEQLLELYWDFGPGDAISLHRETGSYCTRLAPGYRLLALNDDREGWGADRYGFTEDQLEWIQTRLEEAEADGDRMIAMCHHPLLPPVPIYQALFPFELLDQGNRVGTLLADHGVELLFSGHTHMQHIGTFDSERGNRLYEINTAALIGYPGPLRRMELDDHQLRVETLYLDRIDYDLGGKTYETYLKDHFDFMLRDILDSAANNMERFCRISHTFSLKEETARKYRIPIHLLGKFLAHLTFRRAGALLLAGKRIPPAMRNRKLSDFLIQVLNNVYAGTENIAPGSPEYEAFMVIASRIVHLAVRDRNRAEELKQAIEGTLYDRGEYDNNNAELPLR